MHGHDHDAFALEVEAAELEAQIAARRADLAAGIVPPGVHRALYPHELAARTDFAGIIDDTSAAAVVIVQRLQEDREKFLELLAADLAAAAATNRPTAPTARIAERLLDIAGPDGLSTIDGADALIAEAARVHRGHLDAALRTAARRLDQEARAQGAAITEALKLDPAAEDHLMLAARRLAEAPHADVTRALAARVLVEPRDFVAPADLVQQLLVYARTLAESTLRQHASDAAAQAIGLGRQAAAAGAQRVPTAIYASELLDANTCGPCSLVDGKNYPSEADARADYPFGTYVHCEGGSRCRGTLVFVWDETDPTLQEPALR